MKSYQCNYCNRGFYVNDNFVGDIYCPFCGSHWGDVKYVSRKKWSITLLLVFFFGVIGAHRYYTEKWGSAVLYTFTCGFFMIGWIRDIGKVLSKKFIDGYGKVVSRG